SVCHVVLAYGSTLPDLPRAGGPPSDTRDFARTGAKEYLPAPLRADCHSRQSPKSAALFIRCEALRYCRGSRHAQFHLQCVEWSCDETTPTDCRTAFTPEGIAIAPIMAAGPRSPAPARGNLNQRFGNSDLQFSRIDGVCNRGNRKWPN